MINKEKVKKIVTNILRDIGVLIIMCAFLVLIGVITNVAMGIVINNYMIAH